MKLPYLGFFFLCFGFFFGVFFFSFFVSYYFHVNIYVDKKNKKKLPLGDPCLERGLEN